MRFQPVPNAAIVKMVADKVSPMDRMQILTMLKGMLEYLESVDMLHASRVTYEEPLVVIRNLAVSIEKTDLSHFDDSILMSKSCSKNLSKRKIELSKQYVNTSEPAAFDLSEEENFQDECETVEEAEDVTITEEVTNWQPIDVVQYAISSVSNDTVSIGTLKHSPNGVTSEAYTSSEKKYLPDSEEYINPVARVRSNDGVTKWPKYARWVCPYCRLISTKVQNFKQHLKQHKDEGACCCRFCRKEIINAELLKFHSCALRNKCHICKKVFPKPSKLRVHMNVHFKSLIVNIRCKLCSKKNASFTSVGEAAQHVYEEHENNILCDSCFSEMDPYEGICQDPARIYCRKCSDKAGEGKIPEKLPINPNTDIDITSEKLRFYQPKPKQLVTKENAQLYCKVCNYQASDKTLFEKHTATNKHTRNVCLANGEKLPSFACTGCDKVFLSEKYKDDHFRRKHAKESVILNCSMCDKSFMTKGGLHVHMLSHMNLRSFKCDFCGKSFNSNSDLRNHHEWKHTTGLPQKCRQCGERFKHRRALRFHEAYVHDRLVYICPECNLECSKPASLKHHMTQKHPTSSWTFARDYLRKSAQPYEAPPSKKKRKELSESFDSHMKGSENVNRNRQVSFQTKEGGTINASQVSVHELSPSQVSVHELSPSQVSVHELSPSQVSVHELSPSQVSVHELSPGDIILESLAD
ncbi:zinc finger protein 484-like isoform X2 [Watersipora subatra]|uniref:zinc finger protein 484-like isoform X2 n=1 Tax=Watersipora subatra TaxID=2589382 RepID=UPI00355B999D